MWNIRDKATASRPGSNGRIIEASQRAFISNKLKGQASNCSLSLRLLVLFVVLFLLSFQLTILFELDPWGTDGARLENSTPKTRNPSIQPLSKNNNQSSMGTDGTTRSQKTPRIIRIDYSLHGSFTTNPLPYQSNNIYGEDEFRQAVGLIPPPEWYLPNAWEHIDGINLEQCEPMYDWQLSSFQSCNKFHELDMKKFKMINSGGSRTAFEIRQQLNGRENKFVYKTMKFKKDISDHTIEQQRRDSTVMERTTSSQFIPDIHGYCGLAVMMDFMPEGSMHDYIKGARLAGGSSLPPVDKLRIAIHIATSVADLHTIDGTKHPSFFHNDICCHQYLFQDGVFKLNDFNYARPIFVNKKTKASCLRFRLGMLWWKGRSLEEHFKELNSPKAKPFQPEKVDVWMMGVVIYYILTDLYLYEKPEHIDGEESAKRMVEGDRSPLPEHIAKSSDPSYKAIIKALDMCWKYEWRERPPAKEISDYLWDQLRKITGEKNPDVRVVLPERSKDQRPTDSDYEYYNE